MVKSTGSSPKSTGLSDVVEQLRANNRLIDQQNNNIKSLLDEAKDARMQEKKALVAENRQQALEKKSKLERMKESRVKPRGITGNFVRGAIGGTAYSGLRNMTDGMFGGAGFGLGAAAGGLARLAGRGLMFATAAAALNEVAQGALDKVFDNVKPEDIGFKDEEEAKRRLTGGMNIALGAKFLGFRGRTSLLLGIGTAFGDQITGWIADKMDVDSISMPGWVAKTFGLNPDEMKINLKDPKTSAAIGAAVSLIAGQIAIEGAKAATKASYNTVKRKIVGSGRGKMDPTEAFKNRYNNPNPPLTQTDVPTLKSQSSAVDEAVDAVDNIDDVIVRNPNAPKLLGPDGRPLAPSFDTDAPKIKSKRLTATNFDEIKAKQDFKKRVLKAEARYKTKMARSTRIKTLFNQIQNNTKLRKGISTGGKVLGGASFAFSGTMGFLDEERKKAGQTGSQRIAGQIVEDAAGTMDMLVDGAVMLPNMLANKLISPFTDFRFKTKDVTGGLAGETARTGTFILFDKMNEFNANMKSQENLIRDLGYGGYFNGSAQTPPPVIIDNSSGGNTSVSTNNFSSSSEIINKDPYAYGYLGAMQ
jgi:hypothetical protein